MKIGAKAASALGSAGGRGTIFCDEAGFTGNNLLDRDQEVFALAAVALTHEEARTVVERAIVDFRLNGRELKGSKLVKTENGRRAITSIIRRCAPYTRLVFHLKRYALACKFFEYIFEPALAAQNSIFYGCRFHEFISTLLFLKLRVGDSSAEGLFEEFSKFMRRGGQAALQKLFPSDSLIVDYSSDPLQAISVFAMLNRRAIVEELEVVRGDGSTPNWVLDLTTTSLFSALCHWGERFEELEVYCDRSKPLETDARVFEVMVGRRNHALIRAFGKERRLTFNLVHAPRMVDSTMYPGVQIADVFASAIARAFQGRWRGERDATEEGWVKLTRKSTLDDNIWPDISKADIRHKVPFVNSALLLELTERCLKKESLFEGIPEFIATAHKMYPSLIGGPRQRHLSTRAG